MSRLPLNLSFLKFVSAECGDYFINAPVFLVEAFKIIEKNINTVGIFRIAGRITRVQLVKNAFFGDVEIPDEVSVNDVCDAVKAFLRELEEPLLSSALQNQFLRSSSTINREDVKVRTLLQLCRVLSQRHKETLAFLLWHLKKVSESSQSNKMDVSNLAVVISMSVFRSDEAPKNGQVQDAKKDTSLKASVIELLIKHADSICRLAKRSEPIPLATKQVGSRSAGPVRKTRPNTTVGTKESRLTAVEIEQSRRRSGDWSDQDQADCENMGSKSNESRQSQSPPSKKEDIFKASLGVAHSTRRPWQRKLDTDVLNTSDMMEKMELPVPSCILRSVSDAAEKRHLNDDQYRRRSAGVHGKIKRGQPNTVTTGLDKTKTKVTRGESLESPTDVAVFVSDSNLASPTLPDIILVDSDRAQKSSSVVDKIGEAESPPAVTQTASAENLSTMMEDEEEAKDDFADHEFFKRELLSAKHGPPPSFRVCRSPSTPSRGDRPSIAYIRHLHQGRVMQQAAKYESTLQHRPGAATAAVSDRKPSIPTFTQVSNTGNSNGGGSGKRSPTKKYPTRMAVRQFNDTFKL